MQTNRLSNNQKTLNNLMPYIFALIATFFLLIIRFSLFYYESHDYTTFLRHWVQEYRDMTFWQALGTNVGNYNPPYMYLLNIIARIDINDLYLIKFLSVIFDFVLAYFVMKIVSLKTHSDNIKVLAYVLTLSIPTVILNSSMWAQCDSIYSAFAIGSLYFALKGRSKLTYTFMALALGFKLQAAFLFPIFIVFVILRKISLKDCYMFVLVYFLLLFPAIIAGMPVNDFLLVYLNQTDTNHVLLLNVVNIWRFVGDVEFSAFRMVGLSMTALAVTSLIYFAYTYKEKLTDTIDYIRLAYVFAAVTPFLLPQMHDRFFFMADILSLLVFLYDPRRWYVPVVTIFSSYIAYVFFLMNWVSLFDFRYFAIALGIVIILVLRDLVISLRTKTVEVHNDVI